MKKSKCSHEVFFYVGQEDYQEYSYIEYRCNDCAKTGFHKQVQVTPDNVDWEDSL
tara:strand:- start:291 stop:455 length:165 start_codon:yes stop_codon:yes gene_type:complete